MFPPLPKAIRCTCGQVLDEFGDHLLSFGQGSARIRHHDALCNVVFHTLLIGNSKLDVNNNVHLTIAADQEIFITQIS